MLGPKDRAVWYVPIVISDRAPRARSTTSSLTAAARGSSLVVAAGGAALLPAGDVLGCVGLLIVIIDERAGGALLPLLGLCFLITVVL